MIAVDTSALMAIVLNEPQANACAATLTDANRIIISAATIAECLIVSAGREVQAEMLALIDGLGVEVFPVTAETARRVGETYLRWGKGFHRAGLNFGDCFAYDTARARDCPLLFVGNDFAQTDVARAWP
jgi:ribonuclease VapC